MGTCGDGKVGSFRDLRVYKLAFELSPELHAITLALPKIEQYELGGQMRRSSKSVTLNVAEGYAKSGLPNSSLADFQKYILTALGSCDETRAQLDYCVRLGYIDEVKYKSLEEQYSIVARMLVKMLKTWNIPDRRSN